MVERRFGAQNTGAVSTCAGVNVMGERVVARESEKRSSLAALAWNFSSRASRHVALVNVAPIARECAAAVVRVSVHNTRRETRAATAHNTHGRAALSPLRGWRDRLRTFAVVSRA